MAKSSQNNQGKSKSGGKRPGVQQPERRFPVWIPAAALGVVLVLALGGFFGMMKLEETDTFCGSCHTQPEVTYLERTAKAVESAAPVDSASAHMSRRGDAANIHCIDCHAGAGLGGRAAAIFEGASNALRYVTKTMKQPGVMPTWMPDENCLKCHEDVVRSEDYKGKNNHYHYFLARWRRVAPAQAAYCVECHLGHNDTADPKLGFVVVKKTQATCTRCHNSLGRD